MGDRMRRQVSLEEISDGRLYMRRDMVRAGCNDCRGCSSCCSGMGNSVILDPYDIYRLTVCLGTSFEALMDGKIELNVVDGIILPNLSMSSETETCAFLNAQGRCSIHPYRPGICRLFPLGRYYLPNQPENGGTAAGPKGGAATQPGPAGHESEGYETRPDAAGTFRYFLQTHECPAPNKTKVRIDKWLDIPDLMRYEKFICAWHYFLEAVEARLAEESDESVRNINLFVLKLFFIKAYAEDDFYGQFESRLAMAKEVFDL